MKFLLLISIFFCFSCKKSDGGSSDSVQLPPAMDPEVVGRHLPTFDGDPRSSNIIDAHFINYVLDFEEERGVEVTTPISFSYLPSGLLGVCSRWERDGEVYWDILIDKQTFLENESKDQYLAKTIIFHELGHCEMQKDHDNRYALAAGEKVPFSIMSPRLKEGPFWKTYWESHYLKEIFNKVGTLIAAGNFDDAPNWKMEETMRNNFTGNHICN